MEWAPWCLTVIYISGHQCLWIRIWKWTFTSFFGKSVGHSTKCRTGCLSENRCITEKLLKIINMAKLFACTRKSCIFYAFYHISVNLDVQIREGVYNSVSTVRDKHTEAWGELLSRLIPSVKTTSCAWAVLIKPNLMFIDTIMLAMYIQRCNQFNASKKKKGKNQWLCFDCSPFYVCHNSLPFPYICMCLMKKNPLGIFFCVYVSLM